MNKLLDGLTILDFTHRLPGPFGSYLLANQGAHVIKVEDKTFGDAFNTGLFAQMNSGFDLWYKELNSNKQIYKLDFKDEATKEIINQLVKDADVIIQGLPPKLQEKFKITNKDLETSTTPKVVVDIGASIDHKNFMHDLNALAISELLKLHTFNQTDDIVAPPFLPVAGIALGNKLALDVLSALFKAHKSQSTVFNTTYLLEATNEIFGPFWPKKCRETNQYKFLHNGKFPCYCIYKIKDGNYVALAAVEEKFWFEFNNTFNLSIATDKRFYHEDDSIFKKVSEAFLNYTKSEIENIIAKNDFCLSLI